MTYVVGIIIGLSVAAVHGLLAWLRPRVRVALQRGVERRGVAASQRRARLERVGEEARRQASAQYDDNLHSHGRKRVMATTRLGGTSRAHGGAMGQRHSILMTFRHTSKRCAPRKCRQPARSAANGRGSETKLLRILRARGA